LRLGAAVLVSYDSEGKRAASVGGMLVNEDGAPQGHHCLTPPLLEHVPELVSLCEYLPSLQIAAAFAGLLSALSTQVA
jgi:hypothetical protein